MTDALSIARLCVAALLFVLSWFAVFKVPIGALWKPAVGATEYGHILVLVAAAVAAPGWGGLRQTAAFALALGAMLFFATPTLRAFGAARTVTDDGQALWGDLTPPNAQSSAFSPARMFTFGPANVPVQRLVFDADLALELEIYGPFDGPPRPLVIVVHGGSWNSGDYTQLPAMNHYLAQRGYAVAAITYRLAPEHTFPAQRDDVLRAVSWLKDQGDALAIDPDRIALMGRSAGGQLALLTAYVSEDPAIKGVVSYYAPVDLIYAWSHPTNPWVINTHTSLTEYLGGTPEQVPDHFRDASPWAMVTPETPPTLLIHGMRDELVFYVQTERLRDRLAEEGVPHLVVSLPWATHGLEANLRGPSGQISTWTVERFLAMVFT